MSKNDKLVMVVRREILFGDDHFKGFRLHNEVDFRSRVLANFKYMKKGLVEEDPTFKQPIGYSIILNPALKQVFVYQRSDHDKRYVEKRLQGKWSWGVGGHIEKVDEESNNPILISAIRELNEEIEMECSFQDPKLLGYINLEHEVHAVHFGILYIVETESRIVRPKHPEIHKGRLRPIEELEELCSSKEVEVEDWSRIALPPVKSYLNY